MYYQPERACGGENQNKNYMLELFKEFISECKNNPKEMLKDSIALFLIFAFCYLLLVFGAILELN